MPILEENDNTSENCGLYKNEKSILEEQDIEKDYTNLIHKILDIGSHVRDGLSRRICKKE